MNKAIEVIKARYESLMNEMEYHKLEISLNQARFVNGDLDQMTDASDKIRYHKDEYNHALVIIIELKYILEECGYKVLEDWENEKIILKEVNV